jgi:cysteine-rich repeat protein
LSGTVKSTGTALGIANGSITLDLCRLNATSTADLNTNGDYGVNSITLRESGGFAAGSKLQAGGVGGQNEVIYRDPAKLPTLAATATPAVVLSLDETLIGCPVCGNSEIDYRESCDDGNLVDGDGCAADCQLETCIAQTPGYPGVPICDDGSGCTVDVCDQSSGNCQNTSSCDDGIACTDDSCDFGTNTCVNAASNANCDDGNDCTTGTCNLPFGCTFASQSGSCDDGDTCTSGDACVLGVCQGTDNGTCSACGDGTVDPGEACDDGNATWALGEACDIDCLAAVLCGDPNNDTIVTASDALFALQSAVGSQTCALSVCDVDAGGDVTASDALRLLQKSVGQPVTLACI